MNQKKKSHPDAKLLNRCEKGITQAQKELYDRFSPKMFMVCMRFAKDRHQAEDLLQDGFIKVFKNISKFRREGSLEGWIRRIVVNTAIEHYRRKNPLYPVNDVIMATSGMVDNKGLDTLMVNDLMELINNLSDGYKTVFNLYVIEGFSHKEIAGQLGISEGTSKSQLARARYILQGKIQKKYQSRNEQVV